MVEAVIEDGYVDKLRSVVKFKTWLAATTLRICFLLLIRTRKSILQKLTFSSSLQFQVLSHQETDRKNMNNSGIVVENVFKGEWWDQNNRQINYAFMIVPHLRSVWHVLRGVTVIRFFQRKLDIFCQFSRTYLLQKEFSRLMFPQTCSGADNWIRLDFAGNKRGERMNRLLDYAIVQLKPVSWSIFSRLLKRLGILEPRRSHKIFLKCWLYRFLWMLPSLKFMSSFSWVCIFPLCFAIPCALALYANLFSVTNRQVYSPLIKGSQK